MVPITPLQPGYEETRRSYITVDNNQIYTHIRLNYFPDGGIARLKVYGEVECNFASCNETELIDLMGIHNGAVCLSYSNAHYGHPSNLIKPTKGKRMDDGWETARRLDRPAVLKNDAEGNLIVTGSEFAIFRLGGKGRVQEMVIDTNHFKGNYADRIQVEGALLGDHDQVETAKWSTILKNFKLSADREHFVGKKLIQDEGPFNYVKVTIMPDGGVSRIRIYGYVCK